ncbi:MAG TPA: hypothetical protein PLH79_11335 [bacterium]|nr:hypothetical protein [Candidatus Omnitrophota bacterium]HOL94932.1 hypothetical protein [bacterium]HPO99376.1 hypothetical protein [bacterium]
MERRSFLRRITKILGEFPLAPRSQFPEGRESPSEEPPPTLLQFAHQHNLCLEIRKDGTGRYHAGFSGTPVFYQAPRSKPDHSAFPRRLFPRSAKDPLRAARRLCDKIRGQTLILNCEYGVPLSARYVKKTVAVHPGIYVDENEFEAYLLDQIRDC